jgi:UDP-3-O-[3-hydroxymyristoyl] glucosamine N-acyltransferase
LVLEVTALRIGSRVQRMRGEAKVDGQSRLTRDHEHRRAREKAIGLRLVHVYSHSPDSIHPTAVVSPGAESAYDCFIGPYCIVGDEVQLGDGVRLESHCVVDGRTSIGAAPTYFPSSQSASLRRI